LGQAAVWAVFTNTWADRAHDRTLARMTRAGPKRTERRRNMGRRGPPPTPTTILKLRGSWRGELNRDEPQPEAAVPEKPTWLDAYASDAWDSLVPMLERMRVLTEADGKALTLLCITWSRWRHCEEFVAEHGEVYPIKDREGKTKEL